MTYASQDQIQLAAGGSDRFTSLTDWDGDGTPDPGVIAEAQARADGWLDGYLRQRYSTPIAAPTDTLQRLAADECVYWLRSKRGMLGPEDIEQRKEREREMEKYRKGELRPDEPLPAKSSAVVSAIVPNGSCEVSRDSLKGIW